MKKQSKGKGDSPKGYDDVKAWLKDGTKRQAGPKVTVNTHGGGDVKVEGKKAKPRLDKRARGGKVKHKPADVSVNVVNVRRGRPNPRPGFQGGGPVGLPTQAAPRAAAALAARPALPAQPSVQPGRALVMPLTEQQRAVEQLTRALHGLGCETQPLEEEAKVRIRFPESPRRRVIQLLRDGGWEFAFVGMTPRLCLADGRMPLWHVFEINLDRQPGDRVTDPAEPQHQLTEEVGQRLLQS
jgi:hypothetical protein